MSFFPLILCLLMSFSMTSALTCTVADTQHVGPSCSGASTCAAMYYLIGEQWLPYLKFCISPTSSQSDADQWTWLSPDSVLYTCTSSDNCNNEQPPAPTLIPHRPPPLPTLTCNNNQHCTTNIYTGNTLQYIPLHFSHENAAGTCFGPVCYIGAIEGMDNTEVSSCQDNLKLGYYNIQDKKMCVSLTGVTSTDHSLHRSIECFCYAGDECNTQALLQWGTSQLEQTSTLNCYVGSSSSQSPSPPTATTKGRYCFYSSSIIGSQEFDQEWGALESTAPILPIRLGCMISPHNNNIVSKQCICDTDHCNLNLATDGLSGAGSISKSSNFQQSNVRVEDLHGIPWNHNPTMNMKKRTIEKLFQSK